MAEGPRETPGFQVWVRRVSEDTDECSLRFRTRTGKGVLRVSRPGVLIVPPARTTGFEDHLNPAQVRASEFLHITSKGRASFRLLTLSDTVLDRLEPEVWTELVRSEEDPAQLALQGAGDVLQLGGATASMLHPPDEPDPPDGDITQVEGFVVPSELAASVEFSTPVGLTDVPDPGRAIPSPRAPVQHEDVSDIIDVVTGAVLLEGEVFDEVIEADPDSAFSATFDSFQLIHEAEADTADSFLDDDPSALRTMMAEPAAAVPAARAAVRIGEEPPVGGGRHEEPTLPTEAEESFPTEPDPAPDAPVRAHETRTGDPPPEARATAGPSAAAVANVREPPDLPGPGRTLVRHLRAQLYARRMEVFDLQERVRELEAQLAALQDGAAEGVGESD